MTNSIITGTGSYIPTVKVPNKQFLGNDFYDADGIKIAKGNVDIVNKLQEITCIRERRYVKDDLNTSDISFLAAENALDGTERENLDYIIVAQNFGDVKAGNIKFEMVPTIAARVKHKLRIKNPYTVAYDIPFGCPGWLHGMTIADYYIKSGDAKKILVIGAETLSRVSDPHDIDVMIFSDGAGATLVEATEKDCGILSHVTRSDTYDNAYLLRVGKSYNPSRDDDELYKIENIPERIMPMTISWLGNSSVATLPTMLDLLQREKLNNHQLNTGDIVVFASVGAGMNINSMVYKMH